MSLTYASLDLPAAGVAVPRTFALVFLLSSTIGGCASTTAVDGETTDRGTDDASASSADARKIDASAPGNKTLRADSGVSMLPPTVSKDAVVCKSDLPFKPEGCACSGDPIPCWTGAPDKRHVGKCHDGMQACELVGEFSAWGACTGQELDCGDADVPDAGPPDECKCVPGVTIACDEDCTTLVICSTTGKKTCQPDGTFSPCREEGLNGGLPDVLGCRSAFYGCLPGSTDGAYSGDCSSAFVCGHAPNGLVPTDTTAATTPSTPSSSSTASSASSPI